MDNIFRGLELKYVIVKTETLNLITSPFFEKEDIEIPHSAIVFNFIVSSRLKKIDVHGGGQIFVNHTKKVVKVFGESGDYGRAYTPIVTQLVKKAMEQEGLEIYQLVVTGTTADQKQIKVVTEGVC